MRSLLEALYLPTICSTFMDVVVEAAEVDGSISFISQFRYVSTKPNPS